MAAVSLFVIIVLVAAAGAFFFGLGVGIAWFAYQMVASVGAPVWLPWAAAAVTLCGYTVAVVSWLWSKITG